MIKKMCPVCDLPVNAGNYCPRCRRVIRNPYTQNVDYYLNERHPEHETECGFHNPYLEADHHGEILPARLMAVRLAVRFKVVLFKAVQLQISLFRVLFRAQLLPVEDGRQERRRSRDRQEHQSRQERAV